MKLVFRFRTRTLKAHGEPGAHVQNSHQPAPAFPDGARETPFSICCALVLRISLPRNQHYHFHRGLSFDVSTRHLSYTGSPRRVTVLATEL